MSKKPLILVTNDDGITAKGIGTLIRLMHTFAEVVVVAPDSPQSAMGHAITISKPLRLEKIDIFGDDILSYQCSGTPADCIKLAKDQVLDGRRPDMVVSGINHGSNTSISVLYSGTMSAAIEAALESLPAIGFSLCDWSAEADFSHCEDAIIQIVKEMLIKGIPLGIALNVNFPPKMNERLKGIKICRQAVAKWEEKFDERLDPHGRKYYWMTGNFVNNDKGEDTDEWAIANNYASIVPCQYDMTAHHAISMLNSTLNF